MKDNNIFLNDKISNNDGVSFRLTKPGFRTRIIGGYDAYKDKDGVTQFGEVCFDQSNTVVLGGGLYILEKLFNVESSLPVAYINDIMDIATTGDPVTEIYPKDNCICLFGVGIGGAGESLSDVYDVKYYEREIMDMVPFRQTAEELSSTDKDKYWFKKQVDVDGVTKTAYYLKKFEATPEIHVLWRDGIDGEDGSEVGTDVHNTPSSNTTPIDTFIEITLKISKNDIREYFEDLGSTEVARVNSIGLFTGVPALVDGTNYDYKQVKLFSKLNINNEVLVAAKDMTISYRIYTS